LVTLVTFAQHPRRGLSNRLQVTQFELALPGAYYTKWGLYGKVRTKLRQSVHNVMGARETPAARMRQ
jgi:hypothetical protein